MAFVERGSFYHYQPPTSCLRRDGRLTASNLRLPTAHARGNNLTSLGESKEPSGRLEDYNLIEAVNMAGPWPEAPPNPFYVPAPDLDRTERDAEDTLSEFNTARGHGHSGGEKDGDFPPVEELLLGAGETQERQRTGSSNGQATGESEGNSEPTAERDRNSATSPRSSEGEHPEESVVVDDTLAEDRNTQYAQREAGGGDQEREVVRPGDQSIVAYNTDSENDSDAYEAVRNQPTSIFKRPQGGKNRASSIRNKLGSPGDPIVVEDNDTDSGGDGTSEEQVENHVSLGTSPTSGGGSEARYFNFHKKGERDTPNTSPPYRNTLSSTQQICGSNGGNGKGLRPDPSTGRDKKNPWNGQETEAGNKKDQETHNTDSGKETTPSLGLTRKRRPSAVEGKFTSKRRPYLSPERDEAGSSQDNIRAQVEGQEWEIVRILGRRETVLGTEYMVRWKVHGCPKVN